MADWGTRIPFNPTCPSKACMLCLFSAASFVILGSHLIPYHIIGHRENKRTVHLRKVSISFTLGSHLSVVHLRLFATTLLMLLPELWFHI